MMKKFQNLAVSLAIIFSSSAAHSAISFNFSYQDQIDNSGFGFDDSAEGALRRNTVEAVGDYLNTVLSHTASVDILWNTSLNDTSSNTLGSMGTRYFTNQGIYEGHLNRHIISGSDPSANNDGSGTINFGNTWNSGLDNVAAGENDLFSVILHEMTHALGASALIESDGTSSITGTYSPYATFLRNSSGAQLVNSSGVFIGNVADLTSNNLTVLANGSIYDIHAPTTFEPGSSISHFDQSVNAIMNPALVTGTQEREYSTADRDLLIALGYTLKPVPEPSSTLLLGLGSLTLIMRRRK